MTARILYLVHSGGMGGALLSLRYLLERLDRTRYEPVAACIHDVPEVMETLRAAGVETLHAPGISVLPHTTGGWDPLLSPLGAARAARAARAFGPSARATEELIRRVRPDLVHLNSLVLAPSAVGARRAGARLVWHVRESVHPGHLGVRRGWLSRAMRTLPDEAVFISEDDRQRLTGGRSGVVIPNFVDHARFDRGVDGGAVRAELRIPADAPVVLFFGGWAALKGAHVLLPALAAARRRLPGLHALVAGAEAPWSTRAVARAARAVLPLVGSGTERQRFMRAYREHGMEGWVHLLPFRSDPERLLAASTVVAFPSTQPHSARPVIEAGAMARPVVGSRIGGVEELVEEGVTGLLVPPGDAEALGDALARVAGDPALARAMGEAGYRASVAEHGAEQYLRRLDAVYGAVLARPAGTRGAPAG